MISLSDAVLLIGQVIPEPHAGLLSGIVFGTKETINTELYNALVTTGTIHIAALSGMNISILVTLLFRTIGQFLPRVISGTLTIGVIIAFIGFVTPSPSILRAGIMGSVLVISSMLGYRAWALLSFIITITIMILIWPDMTGSISFHLSALASLGLILFSRPTTFVWEPREDMDDWRVAIVYYEKRFRAYILDELHTIGSAQVFILPYIFFVFGQLSLIAPVTNLIIAPFVPAITILGLAMCFFGWIWLPCAYPFGWVAWLLLSGMIGIIQMMSQVPFAAFRIW